MAKHYERTKCRTDLPARSFDLEIPVRIDSTLGLSTGTVDWRLATQSKDRHRVSWEALAGFLKNGGTAYRK